MDFSFIDPNVSITTNVFVIIANIINLIYNIPQMYKTWKTKSTKDFSLTFIVMRIIGNTIWIAYAIEISSFLMLLNNSVTVFSSIFIFYYKAKELYEERKKNKSFELENVIQNEIEINNINSKDTDKDKLIE
jgi:MtN3 and saliva related transmembrane protein